MTSITEYGRKFRRIGLPRLCPMRRGNSRARMRCSSLVDVQVDISAETAFGACPLKLQAIDPFLPEALKQRDRQIHSVILTTKSSCACTR
ncbi:hypothetical protein MTBLM1_30306 [Rhodospirillaceae bacterium LM-1]|nr:hypothetical protein MTBLM1_30306 [Rhodospirillaceae bacterium LM-1]